MQQQDTIHLQHRLAQEISTHVQDKRIIEAFRMIPRHLFIENFYNEAGRRKWHHVTPQDPTWLEKVYQDRPLTTSIDSKGDPDVSSSQPDIMANMIKSIKIESGHRVLEIGTGTGYNAAILAYIVGKENVVSIDINPSLLDKARTRIEQTVGPGVTILHADGRNLSEDYGLFDAIIVTGAHERVESSWIRALKPGGRIVFNWSYKCGFDYVMLEFVKDGNGLIGQVAPYEGAFMIMHDGDGVIRPYLKYQSLPVIEHKDAMSQIFHDQDFAFYLAIHRPTLTYHCYSNKAGEKSYSVKESRNDKVVHFSRDKIRGDTELWEDIDKIHQNFVEINRPDRRAFTISVDTNGTMNADLWR